VENQQSTEVANDNRQKADDDGDVRQLKLVDGELSQGG